MARSLRVDYPGARHHVMNRGAGRRPIFASDSDRSRFLQCLKTSFADHQLVLESYCLMDNHFHLGVYCPNGGLSAGMQQVSANYTRWFNDAHGSDGPIFRSRFRSIPIESERYLINVTRYIHLNPKDIPADPTEYAWSSCAVYLGRRLSPAWLVPDVPLRLSGGNTGVADLLSSPGFESRLTSAELLPKQLHDAWRLAQAPTLRDIKLAVQGEPGVRVSGPARSAALVLAAEVSGKTAHELARCFGFATGVGYRSALARARQRTNRPGREQEILEAATATLGV